MTDFPRSLPAFERRFPDEAACAEWLLERRWGSGFACPECGHGRFWRLGRKVLTLQCQACRRETSVTAGTVMHRSHLPLKGWFTAAWLVATHKNGMSARQLWLQLGLGGYKSAWLLLRKLRAAMVDPDRAPLAGLVEVDETSLPFRAGDTPARPGRSHDGKLLVAGAVEIRGRGPGRVRLAVIGDYSAESLGGFVAGNVADGSTVVSDGWSGYRHLKEVKHDPKVIGETPAHLVLPWIHRIFANAKRWALGVYHGLRAEHLQAYWTCPRRVEGWDQNVTRPHACRSLPCRRAPRPGCGSQGSSVAAAGYRTLRPKTHGTEAGDEAMVAYAWHPWAGQSVRVHEAIGRPTDARARCSLAGADAVRMREIPAWMLDAAACRGVREAPEPVAALSALAALRSLLTEAMRAAAVASPAHHRGDRHATPSSPAPGAAAPARTPPGGPAAGAGRGARVGRLAGSDAAGADRADGPPARRARRRRHVDGRG